MNMLRKPETSTRLAMEMVVCCSNIYRGEIDSVAQSHFEHGSMLAIDTMLKLTANLMIVENGKKSAHQLTCNQQDVRQRLLF
jgi:hypothetical protein